MYIRKVILSSSSYHAYRCFPEFLGGAYGEKYIDAGTADGFTPLSNGVFWWLLSIRPGYLVFRQGNLCSIEPYLPCRFARQFGYDQLYVGNLNLHLRVSGNLYEGARA